MKINISFCAVVPIVLLLLVLPVKGEEASVDLGSRLFKDAWLGSSRNDKSCNTCHANGKGLENAGKLTNLSFMINKCIRGPMEGTGIDEETVAMKSLVLYIKSLAK